MHIVKFPWIKHTEGSRLYEIYSVSVSSDGKRLATGGLDGKVKIWSIDTLYKYKDFKGTVEELDNSECRPLCSMTRHAGAITCVRFSPDGRFLATGSDDKLVLIWEKDEEKTKIMAMHRNASSGFDSSLFSGDSNGSVTDVDLEHWTVRKRLVAHDNDVQDMSWAPDSSILVTVGLDRSIVVWNGTTFEKIKKFDIHQSHVKGVVFDPAGKYFATCSDDRSMRIFRYRRGVSVDGNDLEFAVEQVIRDPFAKSPLTTYFRRLSWSPDGLYIAAPNGTNKGVNANVIVKRGSWESELSLIGHRLPCEVCSFSPRLYDPQFNNKSTETVILTAGQDKTLAIWSSSCSTPLAVITEITTKSITDIAWNPNGLNVFICGLDGTLMTLFFDELELGNVVPIEENNRVLVRYGKDRDLFFPESTEQLKLEEIAQKRGILNKPTKLAPDRISTLMNGTSKTDLNNTTHEPHIAMNVLVPRSKKHPNRKMPVPEISSQQKTVAKPLVNILSSKDQKVTITKSGKKRVAPTLISVTASNDSTTTTPQFISIPGTNNLRNKIQQKNSRLSKIIALPYPPLPKNGLPTLVSSIRTEVLDDSNENENVEDAIDYIAETDPSHSIPHSKKIPSKFSSYGYKRGISYLNGDNLLAKRFKNSHNNWINEVAVSPVSIYGEKAVNSNVIFEQHTNTEQIVEARHQYNNNYNSMSNEEVQDNLWTEFNSLTRIDAFDKSHQWELLINEKIVALGSSSIDGINYWCVCTLGGKILLLSETGRQLCCSIELGFDVVSLYCNNSKIMCVLSNGCIYSWSFTQNNGQFIGSSIIEGVSLSALMNTHSTLTEYKKKVEIMTSIESILMRENGLPVVTLVNEKHHHVYTFDLKLDCWIEILDQWYIEQIIDVDDEINGLTGDDKIIKAVISKIKRNTKPSATKQDDETLININKSWKSINASVKACVTKL